MEAVEDEEAPDTDYGPVAKSINDASEQLLKEEEANKVLLNKLRLQAANIQADFNKDIFPVERYTAPVLPNVNGEFSDSLTEVYQATQNWLNIQARICDQMIEINVLRVFITCKGFTPDA